MNGPGLPRPILARVAALVLLLLGFIPFINIVPSLLAAAWYASVVSGWLSGSAIVVGFGVVLAILSRWLPWLWRDGALNRFQQLTPMPSSWMLWVASLLALGCYVAVALWVFDARALHLDEMVQALQARTYALGHLYEPASRYPEFFSVPNVVVTADKVFSQFPPGHSALLALGELFGSPWLINPVVGAISVLLFGLLLRETDLPATVRFAALLLFALAPWVVFMSGTHMNHVSALMWLLLGSLGAVRSARASSPRMWAAFLGGIGFGAAGATRPSDALAFALPAGVWLLWNGVRDRRRIRDLVAAGVGIAIPMAAFLWVNARTTGDPLLLGYVLLWGKSMGIGFHRTPWGEPHTPLRGLLLINLYLIRLQTYLFELPIPSLVPAMITLGFARRFSAVERYLLWAGSLLVILYFMYWHDGFYLGPRFLYPIAPLLALLTARSLGALRERFPAPLMGRTATFGAVTAIALGVTTLFPIRVAQNAALLPQSRWPIDSLAAKDDVRDALVFVRESWGAQLLARMWVLGIPRSQAERIYHFTDACAIETQLGALENQPKQSVSALNDAFGPLEADSARLVPSPFSPDGTERFLPGSTYSERCTRRVNEDRAGYALLLPILLARRGNNVYARDLHERNAKLVMEYPRRPTYLLTEIRTGKNRHLAFVAISRDSLLALH